MYTLLYLYFTAGPALLNSSINVGGLQRYVRPVKLSLRFVAMFPVRLPSLANESSAISAVGKLSAKYLSRVHNVTGLRMWREEELTFFNSIRLSHLHVSVGHAQRKRVNVQSSRPTSSTIPAILQQ